MQIAICDDDRLFLEHFCAQVTALGLARRVETFSTAEAFRGALEDGARYDAVLLDIDWGQPETGLEVAEMLYECAPQTKVIFVTGYSDRFSQRIFLKRANLSGYLVKPVDGSLLRANLEKVARGMAERGRVLTVSVGGKPVSIPHGEIEYLESAGHTVGIRARGEVITVYEKLDKLAPLLGEGFLRCHKSFLVNMRRIRRFREQDVLLDSGEAVPVSRSRYVQTKAEYFRYMGKAF